MKFPISGVEASQTGTVPSDSFSSASIPAAVAGVSALAEVVLFFFPMGSPGSKAGQLCQGRLMMTYRVQSEEEHCAGFADWPAARV